LSNFVDKPNNVTNEPRRHRTIIGILEVLLASDKIQDGDRPLFLPRGATHSAVLVIVNLPVRL